MRERLGALLLCAADPGADIARKLAVHPSTVNRWLNKGQGITLHHFVKICALLQVSPTFMLFGKGPQPLNAFPDCNDAFLKTLSATDALFAQLQDRISQAMPPKGHPRTELATKLKVDRSTICRLANGTFLSLDLFIRFCDNCNFSPTFLIFGLGPQKLR